MSTIEQEKLARTLVGAESDGKHFILNGQKANDILHAEAVNKFNDQVDEYVEKFEKRNERLSEYAKVVSENAENLEIMPIGLNLIVSPFSENPFQRMQKSDKGIIFDLGGGGQEYKSHEDGQVHEEKSFIEVATVICVGPECKWIQEGDTVMYTIPSAVPVPFFKQGLKCLPENRVTAVINENLQNRFNEIKNK